MIYPMTVGLLSSMMMRYNHGIFIQPATWLDVMGPRERVSDTFTDMGLMYKRLTENPPTKDSDVIDRQVYQEITGEGFYHPDSETDYANTLVAAVKLEKDFEADPIKYRV